MKVGIVDLDTSHPGAWIPILREMGHEIVGVWDGGSVHSARYAWGFAGEHGVGRVYDSLQEIVDEMDCVIIHSFDWDTGWKKTSGLRT